MSPTANYTLVNGTIIAYGSADLLDGSIAHSIDVNENGTLVTTGFLGTPTVWTGTGADGTLELNPIDTCQNWTSASHSDAGYVGHGGATDVNFFWTRAVQVACDSSLVGLYCFAGIPVT
jgi:hypothetical protein